jgi:hypothetical protein
LQREDHRKGDAPFSGRKKSEGAVKGLKLSRSPKKKG